MKVLVVDPWHFTPPYNRELCKGLAELGHDVTLVKSTEDEAETAASDYAANGIRTRNLFVAPARWLPRSLELAAKGFLHMLGMLRLLIVVRQLRPDVVHFQWLSLPLVDFVFLPILRRFAPVVLTVHDSNPYMGAGPLLLRAGSRLAIRRCDQFIVHNEISKQRLQDQGLEAERIHQIAHGLLEDALEKHPVQAPQSDERLHFLLFGKLKGYKGADLLLKALTQLAPEEREKARISIVGRPYIETDPLEDFIKETGLVEMVTFRFDFVSDDDMATLFAQTDFLLFPYREIDTSGVLMAAMARGIPVIASNIGCFSEMLTNGEQGLLVPAGDVDELAVAIKTVIAAPEKQHSMADGMRRLCQSIPSWEAIAEKTTTVYEQSQGMPLSEPLEVHS